MATLERQAALQTVRAILAADLACEARCLLEQGVFVAQARWVEGRRRFPFQEISLAIITMGNGTVISCSADRFQWVQENLGYLTRDQLFEPATLARLENYVNQQDQTMAGPALKYLCSRDTFRPAASPNDLDCHLYEREQIQNLYDYPGFPHALKYQLDLERPDVLAVVARAGGQVVGIAGASADCDEMWQIGVDILPAYRSGGIGKTLVGRLTEAIFDRGKIPYYSTAVSNLPSRNVAIGLGYWPAWVELYARER